MLTVLRSVFAALATPPMPAPVLVGDCRELAPVGVLSPERGVVEPAAADAAATDDNPRVLLRILGPGMAGSGLAGGPRLGRAGLGRAIVCVCVCEEKSKEWIRSI